MTNIVSRTAGKAHLNAYGVGWTLNEYSFSNPAGTLNLITTPTSDYKIAHTATRNTLQPLPEGGYLLDVQGAIDAKVAPLTTALYTVPTGLSLEVKGLYLRCTSAVAITVPASASAGEGAAANNVYGDQILTGLTTVGLAWRFLPGGLKAILTAGQIFGVRLLVAAVGTSQTLEAQLYGRLFV